MNDIYISTERSNDDKAAVRNILFAFNAKHIPEALYGKREEINLILKDHAGSIFGGLVGEVCLNWLEVHYLVVDEELRHLQYGSKLLAEAENIARSHACDFIKLDTFSFQALDFYKKYGYEVYGQIENAAGHTHYYLKKDLHDN